MPHTEEVAQHSRPRGRRRFSCGLLLAALFAIAAIAGCGDEGTSTSDTSQTSSQVTDVSPEQVAPDVQRGDTLLVDVREDAEWDAGHAKSALHVPLGSVQQNLSEIEREAAGRPIAFICRSGSRSAQAAEIAAQGGLEDILNVTGGMEAWVESGQPLVPPDGKVI